MGKPPPDLTRVRRTGNVVQFPAPARLRPQSADVAFAAARRQFLAAWVTYLRTARPDGRAAMAAEDALTADMEWHVGAVICESLMGA